MVQLESCSTRPPTLLIFNSHVKLKVRARKPHCPSNMPPAQSRHGDHLPKLLTTIAHGPHRARLDGSNPRCSVGLRNAHQKSASSENSRPPPLVPPPITPAFWYSPTRRSKKLVLPYDALRSVVESCGPLCTALRRVDQMGVETSPTVMKLIWPSLSVFA